MVLLLRDDATFAREEETDRGDDGPELDSSESDSSDPEEDKEAAKRVRRAI